MKKWLAILFSFPLALSMIACGSAASGGAGSGAVSSAAAAEQEQANSVQAKSNGTQSKMLVAYFSQVGEQYNVGVIEEGNTSIIAHMIAEQTGADLFEIEPAAPYPSTLDELLDVSEQEKAADARPEIAGAADISDYDVIFIGYPIWWGDMPMIVYNFLESYDFSGKTVVPFCTHGGSGLAQTERAIADITRANMLDGLAIAGTTAQNNREQARAAVAAWLEESGLVEAE